MLELPVHILFTDRIGNERWRQPDWPARGRRVNGSELPNIFRLLSDNNSFYDGATLRTDVIDE